MMKIRTNRMCDFYGDGIKRKEMNNRMIISCLILFPQLIRILIYICPRFESPLFEWMIIIHRHGRCHSHTDSQLTTWNMFINPNISRIKTSDKII